MRNWLLLLLLLGLTLTAQERMALVIGNSAYRHWSHLKNPAQEVGQVAKQLRHCGFTLYRDRPLVDMSGAQMQELLTAFKRHILNTNIQVVLVYYAGHGFEFAGDQYLAPVDMPQDLTAKGRAIAETFVQGKRARIEATGVEGAGDIAEIAYCRGFRYPRRVRQITTGQYLRTQCLPR